jgi:tetratricopeptide (TPR) repeat protein
VRLRKQALDWLRADLNVAARRLESSTPPDSWARWFCTYSTQNPDLVSIRDPAALAKLPAEERQACTQLWADMAAALKGAQGAAVKTGGAIAPSTGTEDQLLQSLIALNNQGIALLNEGRLKDAEKVFADGVGKCLRELPSSSEITGVLFHHHADALRALGRLDDALPEARRAMVLYTENPDWPASEASHALAVLQAILRGQGKPDEAIAARRDWVATHRRRLPAVHVDLANHLRIFGDDLLKQGTLAAAREAESLYRECVEIRVKAIPESWLIYSAKSLQGAAVLAVIELDVAATPDARIARLREAERLLLDSHLALKDNAAVPTPAQAGGFDRKREALERVVRLYELWNRIEPGQGHDAQAAEIRKALDAGKAPAPAGK